MIRNSAESAIETTSALAGLTRTLCNRNREHPPLVDFHVDFFEPSRRHQFVNLGGGTAAHDPRLTFAIAQRMRDEFELGMPWLICVDQEPPGLDRISQPVE